MPKSRNRKDHGRRAKNRLRKITEYRSRMKKEYGKALSEHHRKLEEQIKLEESEKVEEVQEEARVEF